MYKQFKYALLPGVIASTLILTACGGGSSSNSPAESTDVVARGPITAIGSIHVAGVKWETESASYSDDDDDSVTGYVFTVDDIGKKVTIKGKRNDDGVTGTVTEVEYEAELEGVASVDSGTGAITIGTKTIITSETVIDGTRYEVSGYWIDDNTINATFIKKDDDDGVNGDGVDEIKGTVTDVVGTSITVRGTTYTFSGAYEGSTKVPAIGDYVEVHFTAGDTIATKVELEDDFMDDLNEGQEFEVEGVVNMTPSSTCPDGTDFMVDDFCVQLDSTGVEWSDGLTMFEDLIDGIRVEVEGHKSGDLLIADEVKARGKEVRITAQPDGASTNGSFTFFGGKITVNTDTFTDTDETALDTLLAGDGVEVRGIRTDDGSGTPEILALKVKAEDATTRNEIRAQIETDGADESGETITVLGITKTVNSSTQLRIEEVTYTGTLIDFLTSIDDDASLPNDVIEVRFDVGATVADQIEIELEDD